MLSRFGVSESPNLRGEPSEARAVIGKWPPTIGLLALTPCRLRPADRDNLVERHRARDFPGVFSVRKVEFRPRAAKHDLDADRSRRAGF